MYVYIYFIYIRINFVYIYIKYSLRILMYDAVDFITNV
jgi:hypothetical protein